MRKKLAPQSGRVSSFVGMPATVGQGCFPTDSDAYGSVIGASGFPGQSAVRIAWDRCRIHRQQAGSTGRTSAMSINAGRPARAYSVGNASGMSARPVVTWARRDGYPRARTKWLTPQCGRLPNALVVHSAMPRDPSAHYSP
jgi:hypothetical protein